ncbi:MAG: TetR/AcrR family transcriptional regulator [Caulobacteraceae bacterium]
MSAAAKPRRKADEIRASLIEAAGSLFAAHGYDGVSVRDIAAAAGVQASVIIRYFGSKEALFRQVLTTSQPEPFEPAILPRLPQLLAQALIDPPPVESFRRRSQVHQIAIRSLGSPEARDMIAEDLGERYIEALARILPGEDGLARAGLLVSFMMGVRMMREILKTPALDESQRARLRPLVEGLLSQLVQPAP